MYYLLRFRRKFPKTILDMKNVEFTRNPGSGSFVKITLFSTYPENPIYLSICVKNTNAGLNLLCVNIHVSMMRFSMQKVHINFINEPTNSHM